VAETPTLRPLAVGEVLDAGINVVLRHWKPLIACVAGIVLPLQILSVLVLSSVDTTAVDFTFSTSASDSASDSGAGAVLVVQLLTVLGVLLANATCFKVVADAWLGSEPSAKRSLGFALRRLASLVWLAIILVCALALAFLALVVPFVWLAVAWSLSVPALLFERRRGFKALARSFRLVRGRWWPILGALICAYLLAIFIELLLSVLPQEIADAIAPDNDLVFAIATVVGGTASQMITVPYLAAVITLLYFDMRVRKEAFDLQLLADGLGQERDPDAPLPAPRAGADVPMSAPRREWWRDPVPAGPGTYGSGFEAPSSEERPPAAHDQDKSPERDRERADWLPPEAPRGPGGL
jgi:hypothetical protein